MVGKYKKILNCIHFIFSGKPLEIIKIIKNLLNAGKVLSQRLIKPILKSSNFETQFNCVVISFKKMHPHWKLNFQSKNLNLNFSGTKLFNIISLINI